MGATQQKEWLMRRSIFRRAWLALAVGMLALVLIPAAGVRAADLYPYGQCTYYAKLIRTDAHNTWGNARDWAAGARRDGFPVSSKPRVGDIIVLQPHVQGVSRYGHVGIVTAVRGTKVKTVSMWGNEATGRLHVVWYTVGRGVSFIHRR
jgi:hypothetical protein